MNKGITGLKKGELNLIMARGKGTAYRFGTSIIGTIEIMDKPLIHAVAIMQGDILYTLPKPARHHHVIAYIVAHVGKYNPNLGEQGFITDSGHFVTREQAAMLALASGQVTKLTDPPELFSEDVWQ